MAAPPPGSFDNAKLRRLRLDLGLKQVELANRIGVDPVVLSSWERPGGRPSARNLGRIAAALGLEVADLYRSDPAAAGTLADLRVQAGLGQRELACALDVSKAAVSRWERKVSAPPTEILPRYAQALGTTVVALIRAAKSTPRPEGEAGPKSAKRRQRTPEEVRQMRQLYEQGGITFAELARRFDCNAAAVSRICKGISFPVDADRKRCWPDADQEADTGLPLPGV